MSRENSLQLHAASPSWAIWRRPERIHSALWLQDPLRESSKSKSQDPESQDIQHKVCFSCEPHQESRIPNKSTVHSNLHCLCEQTDKRCSLKYQKEPLSILACLTVRSKATTIVIGKCKGTNLNQLVCWVFFNYYLTTHFLWLLYNFPASKGYRFQCPGDNHFICTRRTYIEQWRLALHSSLPLPVALPTSPQEFVPVPRSNTFSQ